MKRVWISFFLMVLILTVCIIENITIEGCCNKVNDMISQATYYYKQKDFTKTSDITIKLENYWIKAEKLLSLYINHTSISDISMSIARLEPLSADESKGDFLSECKLITIMLLHIKQDEQINLISTF